MTTLSPDWQQYFMRIAAVVATKSKDASSKFGAVLVRPNKSIASTGFNGFPARLYDNQEYLTNPAFREKKYPRIVHAEANCLNYNKDSDTSGYSLVVNGPPCAPCALRMASTGITDVYFTSDEWLEQRWADSIAVAREIFQEAGIKLHLVQV